MKLFVVIAHDARLLGHFLHHYQRAGITEFFIAAPPRLQPAIEKHISKYSITAYFDICVADTIIGGISGATEMRHRHQSPTEWAVIVDLDEFVEFPVDIHEILFQAERERSNVVRGIMWDRFGPDGQVVAFEPESDLRQVFPIRARFIRNVMQGADWKGVLVKGLLRGIGAHHVFENEVICSRELEISHYKWFDGSIERLRAAYTEVTAAREPWAREYERILLHYEQYGRFAWERFGGEVANDGCSPAHSGIMNCGFSAGQSTVCDTQGNSQSQDLDYSEE